MFCRIVTLIAILSGINCSVLAEEDVLRSILQNGVDTKVFPGAVGLVGDSGGILYSTNVGHHTYDQTSPQVSVEDSVFDLASVSKVLSSTSAVALLYQRGYLTLDTKLADVLGEDFTTGGKEGVTVENCLLHNAGFDPDPVPWFWSTDFGCPNTEKAVVREDFSCIEMVNEAIMTTTLSAPPGERFLYSDFSMLAIQMFVGQLVQDNSLVCSDDLTETCYQEITDALAAGAEAPGLRRACYFEAFVRLNIFESEVLPRTGLQYLLARDDWVRAVPTINDTDYMHRRVQGQVSDGDCYAMGGVCGHAGVFGSGPAVSGLLQYLVGAPSESHVFLNSTTVELFTTLHDGSFSSRALGWDTNSYDYSIEDQGYDNSCGSFPEEAFMHIGYTGTCVCGVRGGLWSVVLTNRVFNCNGQSCPSELSTLTKDVYRKFNTEAHRIYAS